MCCYYIKDDGERCGRDADPYCHDHNDTIQAELYEKTEERFGNAIDGTVLPVFWKEIEAVLSESAEGFSADFTRQTIEHTCDQCEAPVRRCVRSIEPSQYSREMADVIEGFVCQCGIFVRHDRTGGRIEKEKLPECWL